MTIRTYMALVNDALAECKVSLDPLTSVNFDAPPRTILYGAFKRWANKAYRDLMLERSEWFFRVERTTIRLLPRLHISGLSYVPVTGDVLEGATSGVRFTVRGVYTFEDNEMDTVVERTVDVEYASGSLPTNLRTLEQLNRISPNPASNVGFFRSTGRYNLAVDVLGLETIDPESVVFLTVDTNKPILGGSILTRVKDGNYEVLPAPLVPFVLQFDYTRSYADMVAFSDTPVNIPERYEDILLWKVVLEYADYDSNGKLFSRANKNIDKYNYYLNRDTLPTPTFESSRFNYRNIR